MTDPFSEGDGGAIVRVRVTPKSRRPGIGAIRAGALQVDVSAAPERGKATSEAVELLASRLGIARSRVRLMSGSASRDKRFLVAGLTAPDLRKRLRSGVGGIDSGTG